MNSTWYPEIEEPIKSREKHYSLVLYILIQNGTPWKWHSPKRHVNDLFYAANFAKAEGRKLRVTQTHAVQSMKCFLGKTTVVAGRWTELQASTSCATVMTAGEFPSVVTWCHYTRGNSEAATLCPSGQTPQFFGTGRGHGVFAKFQPEKFHACAMKSPKSTFSQPFKEKCISEVVRIGSIIIFSEKAMKSQFFTLQWYDISGETAGEIWRQSFLELKWKG